MSIEAMPADRPSSDTRLTGLYQRLSALRAVCIVLVEAFLLVPALSWGAEQTLQAVPLFDASANSISPVGRTLHVGGSIYGVTGGTATYGSIFKVAPDGTVSILHAFNISDGLYPMAGLTKGPDGALYGTTSNGGTNGGWGTIFKITVNGEFSSIFSFAETNGYQPSAELLLGSDGNFYGTTHYGWAADFYHGTIFRVSPAGDFSTLVSLDGEHGAEPMAALMEGKDHAFYGTTSSGGSSDLGTIFRITADGHYTCLFSFNGTNGSHPQGGLLQCTKGTFYGTTTDGGQWGYGTIFEFDGIDTLKTLVSFDKTNGRIPETMLVERSDGLLYGTTLLGGEADYGTLFKLSMDGVLTTLSSFDQSTGVWPSGWLEKGPDGNLYGNTATSSLYGAGSLFRLVNVPKIRSISLSSGLAAMTWTTFPEGIYDLEYTDNLAPAVWLPLVKSVIATNSLESVMDSSGLGSKRFYRVKLNPWNIKLPPL
jgi:uncharacterized repeat protein (TIGR03803 family)